MESHGDVVLPHGHRVGGLVEIFLLVLVLVVVLPSVGSVQLEKRKIIFCFSQFLFCFSHRVEFTRGEEELHAPPVGDHGHHKEREGKSRRGGLHHPEDDETDELEDGEHVHPPGLHLLDVGDAGVVLGRHYEELHPVEELNTVHPGDAHVEEDTEEHGKRNFPEDGTEDDGDSEHDGDDQECDPLVPHPHRLLTLARDA